MAKKKQAGKSYLVVGRTSTRKSADPKSPGYETWVDFEPGMTVITWPKHAPVDEWVASGHWQPEGSE